VTLRDHTIGPNGESNHRRWDHGGPSLPGLSPTREVPDDHHDLACCPDPSRAGVHQHRAAGASRIPGRVQRLDRQAYELDLRQYAGWCQQHHLRLFQARRADIECFARDLETRGRARATMTRRLCTIAGFYRYAVEEDLLDHSLAAHVRRPRLDYESHATGLDRNELGALLVAAGLGSPAGHALISLLALNGLRVSEATGADIQNLGIERGHRTLVITRKGGKVVTIPLAPRTARAIDLAVGERLEGPIFLTPDRQRLDRHGAARIVRRVAIRAGISKPVGPHTLRHAFITAALDAGVPLRDVQEAASHADPRTTMRYDRARGSLDRHATYIVAAYLAGAAR
jgi:integrase/recombinase XerD